MPRMIPRLALWLAGAIVLRVAVIPPEVCPEVGADEVQAAAVGGGDWLVRGLGDDDRFVYEYNKATDLASPAYNTVRHAGVVNSLFQLVDAGETRFLDAADRGLAYMLDRMIDHEDWSAFVVEGERVSLGANGFVVTALAHRRLATGDVLHDDTMRAVGRFILAQQEPDGAILSAWDPATGAPTPGRYGPFATGEAAWALAMLHGAFPDEGWGEAAQRTLRYLADGRVEKEGYTVNLPDHWAAYALAEFSPDELDADLVAYAARLAGYFGWRLRFESQRTGEGVNLLVRWYPGPPSGVGTAGEGLAALYRLGQADPRLAAHMPGMRDHLECFAGMMVEAQIEAEEAGELPSPTLAEGAWFYRDTTRMDDQQHVLSGLLQVAAMMRTSDTRSAGT